MPAKKRQPPSDRTKSDSKKFLSNEDQEKKTVQKKLLPVLKQAEEKDFPRGSKSLLSPLEVRTAYEQAKRDTPGATHSLFSASFGEKKSSSLSKKKRTSQSALPVAKRSSAKAYHDVKFPSPKTLTAGILLLGCVKEVRDFEANISLPFNMQANLSHAGISDPISKVVAEEMGRESDDEESSSDTKHSLPLLKQLFSLGQYLVCRVVELKGKKVIVSVNPSSINANITTSLLFDGMILPGWVDSIEDHGILFSFGVEGVKGFLKKTAALEYARQYRDGCPLLAGQVLMCMITSVKNPKAVGVCINPKKIHSSAANPDEVFSPIAILPGTTVAASVDEAYDNCLKIKFLGGFEGFVGSRHLPGVAVDPRSLTNASKLRAKVLWVNTSEKIIGLTLKAPTIAGEIYQTDQMPMGKVFEEACVLQQDKSKALLLDLGHSQLGLAPLALVYEDRVESFEKRHKVGSKHRCRVVSHNLMDCCTVVTLKESLLNEDFLNYRDIKPGDIVTGHFKSVTTHGVILAVNPYISGFCPNQHLSNNSKSVNMEKIKNAAKQLKCRVLNVDPSRFQMTLTHKKGLVDSELPVLSDYGDVVVGQLYPAFVKAVHGWGCVVGFYNYVKGIVQKSDLGILSSAEPSDSFKEGQVVVCRAVSCQAEDKKLKVSLEIGYDTGATPLEPGQIAAFTVEGISVEGLSLRSDSGEKAFLPTPHLSDHLELCGAILQRYQTELEKFSSKNDPLTLEGLVVCQKLPMRQALITCKASFLEGARAGVLVTTFDDLKDRQVLTGFIKKSELYGVFVEFPGNLVGLCPNKYVKDEFITNSVGLFTSGQTVRAKVMELDSEKRRIIVNLRCSDLKFSLAGGQAWRDLLSQRLRKFLGEKEAALGLKSAMAAHPMGAVREAKVVTVDEEDKLVHLELRDGTLAVASTTTLSDDVKVEESEEVKVVVIDHGQPLVVSLNQKLLSEAKSFPLPTATDSSSLPDKKKSKAKKRLEKTLTDNRVPPVEVLVSSKVLVTVECLFKDHAVCSVTTLSSTGLVYGVFDNGQYGGRPMSLPCLQVGRVLRGVVLEDATVGGGVPVVLIKGDASSSGTDGTEALHFANSLGNINVGDVVDALVVRVTDTQVDIRAGPMKGRIHISMATDDLEGEDPALSCFGMDDIVKARVLKIRKTPGHPAVMELCARESIVKSDLEISQQECSAILSPAFHQGSKCLGVVRTISSKGIIIHLSPTAIGHIPAQLASKDLNVVEALSLYFREGQVLECEVISRGSEASKQTPKLSLIGAPPPPEVGDRVVARVMKIDPSVGLFVSLYSLHIGNLHITDLSDEYTNEPLAKFKVGEFVNCAVIGNKDGRYALSMRPSQMGVEDETVKDKVVTAIKAVEEKAIMRGYVKVSSKQGVFVWVGRDVCGRIKFGNLTDGFVEKPMEHFTPGQLITFSVLSVNAEANQLELSTRLSHVDPEAAKKLRAKRKAESSSSSSTKKAKRKKNDSSEPQEMDSSDAILLPVGDSDSDDEEGSVVDDSGVESVESDGDGDGDGGVENSLNVTTEGEMMIQGTGARLEVDNFQWDLKDEDQEQDGLSQSDNDSDAEDDATAQVSSKVSKRQKKAVKKLEEQKLYEMELSMMDPNRPLESTDDFERLVVTNPDSSSSWIHYILHHLSAAQVDKAKAVAHRALATIAYNKESEKLNVWVALLNLENMYGTQQSLHAVFQSALQQNDPEKIYWKLVAIYRKTERFDMAEELFKTMIKKFSVELQVWIGYAEFLMSRAQCDAARHLLEKSFKHLHKSQHVDMIVKFAEFEHKMGDPGRGQTLFENVVANYPKRLDVWSRYFDTSIKQGDRQATRMLFERAIQLNLTAKRMKFFFSRYLEFEKSFGTVASVDAVREKAGDFVARNVRS